MAQLSSVSDPMELDFDQNRADPGIIAAHLLACDAQFVPQLSARVNLTAYSAKMAAQAVKFEAWAADRLVGLVAGYANDPELKKSFISNVSVLPEWHGRGVASHLLRSFVAHVREAGFYQVFLSVDMRNEQALRLYRKHGFSDGPVRGTTQEMAFNLRTTL